MRLRLQILLYAVIILLLAAGGYYYYTTLDRSQQKVSTPPATVVSTIRVTQSSLPIIISGIGSVIPAQETQISPKQAGYIENINFQEGEKVKEGQLLIKLDDTEIKAQLENDLTQLQTKKAVYLRYSIAQKEGLVANMDYSTAKADYEKAVGDVAEDKIKLADTSLYAPFSGYIGSNNLSVGQYVSAGQQLATLVNRTKLKVVYAIPAQYANQVELNQAVTVYFHSYPNKNFPGKVTFVSPEINTNSGTIDIHATMDNPGINIFPGEFVSVQQVIGHKNALTIPENAIINNLEGSSVFTINNGKAEQVHVTQGINNYGQVEITRGLQLNEVIINQGAQIVKDGQPVTITQGNS
jgi:membrane fusion protein (multidrug efflux system)